MNTQAIKFLTGLLLDWPTGPIQKSDLEACRRLKFEIAIRDTKWEQFIYVSETPLRGEDVLGASPPFNYPVLCRRSGSRLLLLSVGRPVVEHILKDELDPVLGPGLRRVSIAVDSLVKKIAVRPTSYVLSFVHARVPAFGASLRSVSFYGDDLAEASIFREQMNFLVFFICGLRQATGGGEIVRLAGDGGVSFLLTDPPEEKVREVEEVLKFLRKYDYLESHIWEDERLHTGE